MTPSLELSVIGSFLVGGDRVRKLKELVKTYGITADFFTDNDARRAFEVLLADSSVDPGILARNVGAAVGVAWTEEAASHAAVDLPDADKSLQDFANAYRHNRIKTSVMDTILRYRDTASPEFVISALSGQLKELSKMFPKSEEKGLSLAEISDPVPEDENPKALIRGGWFRKGHGVFFISTAGSGKSVITLQICYAWALGRPVFGIEPVRPMTIGIFQTEDDEDEISEFRASMRRGYAKRFGWTEKDIAEAERRVEFFDPKGRMGKSFLEYFREIQSSHKFDLAIINPLQGVTDFDLGQNSLLNDFLSNGPTSFDGIIKDPDFGCGLLIIHHTNKPPSGPERNSFGHDQFAQYIGAGGQVLNRWARSFLTLLPTSEPDIFHLLAAKREKRLDWTIPPGVKSAKPLKIIAQEPKESGYLFWHEVGADDLPPSMKPKDKLDPSLLAGELVEEMQKQGRAVTAGELRDLARARLGRKIGDQTYEFLIKNVSKYNVTVRKMANSNVRLYEVGVLPL